MVVAGCTALHLPCSTQPVQPCTARTLVRLACLATLAASRHRGSEVEQLVVRNLAWGVGLMAGLVVQGFGRVLALQLAHGLALLVTHV